MANNLATTEVKLSAPTVEAISRIPTPEVALLTDFFHNGIIDEGRQQLALPALPTPQQKKTLEKRRADIVGFLRGHDYSMAGKARVETALMALFGSYFNHRASQEDVLGLMILMRERPTWAIEEVCQDIFDGRVYTIRRGKPERLDPNFLPSGSLINQAAIEKCVKLEAELFKLKRVLDITRVIPERMRVKPLPIRMRMFSEVQADGSTLTNDYDAFDRERTAARRAAAGASLTSINEDMKLQEYAALGIDPIRDSFGNVLSVALARSVGRIPKERPPRPDDRRTE